MSAEGIKARVVQVVLETLRKKRKREQELQLAVAIRFGPMPETIGDDESFADEIGLDSLDRVELAMDLEEEFRITISVAEIDQLDTVAQVEAHVQKKLKPA